MTYLTCTRYLMQLFTTHDDAISVREYNNISRHLHSFSKCIPSSKKSLLFYATDFSPSVTVVVVDIVSAPGAGSVAHARDGNLWKRAARYLGWLESHRKKISFARSM